MWVIQWIDKLGMSSIPVWTLVPFCMYIHMQHAPQRCVRSVHGYSTYVPTLPPTALYESVPPFRTSHCIRDDHQYY